MIVNKSLSKIPVGTVLRVIKISKTSAWFEDAEFLEGRVVKVSDSHNLVPLDKSENAEWVRKGINPNKGVYTCNGTYEILQP